MSEVTRILDAIAQGDQYGKPFSVPDLTWSAVGGSVTHDGVFTPGETEGVYNVRVRASGHEALAEVRITKDGPPPPPPPPGKRTLRWRGSVPPQKWMHFYTKLLTRFASSPDLKLEVTFEVAINRDQAQSKADETRSGLKELGLDDTTSLT